MLGGLSHRTRLIDGPTGASGHERVSEATPDLREYPLARPQTRAAPRAIARSHKARAPAVDFL